jgi:hypothetical protein
MPETIEEVTVVTKKDGKAGYILFTPNTSFAKAMQEMDVQAVIEHDNGYMKVGMGEAYTIRMLAQEFWELTQRQWEFYPINGYRRWTDGPVVHRITWDLKEYQAVVADDSMSISPAKILEERGRGTEIRKQMNQGKLLKYWAWSQLPIEVGVHFPETTRTIEYWMNIVLQPVPGDEDPTIYLLVLKEAWMERLREISNGVAQNLETLGNDFGTQLRYLYNCLRVWFVPLASTSEVKRPLAEEPCPKDKWYTWSDLMAFTHPPLPDDQIKGEDPAILFGPGCVLQERYIDQEVQGGKIALIAFKQMRAQKPPNGLDRMQSVFLKQVAYNQRVIQAEEGIAGTNTEVADFLTDLSLDPAKQLVICVNGSAQMKRNEEAIGGQLWMQEGRQMTASNKVIEGLENTREPVVLSEVREAVTWRHVTELDGPRKGQRVVIYPKDLPQPEAVLNAGDPKIDSEDGHPIAYAAILEEKQKFENLPVFLKEDSEEIVTSPIWSELVPIWMATAEQVATENRKRVLEDGPDKQNSDDEEIEDMKPDEEPNMYTSEMDPQKGPVMLPRAQVAAQKAAFQAQA